MTLRRLVPHPTLAVLLFVMWLMLAGRITPGQILLGALVAVAGAWTLRALGLDWPPPRRPMAMLRFIAAATVDILRSNIAVARIILNPRRRRTSRFLIVPLELRHPVGLAVLACIITATPGTIWLNYDRGTGRLLLHILDLVDEERWIALIKSRYERRLMEILE